MNPSEGDRMDGTANPASSSSDQAAAGPGRTRDQQTLKRSRIGAVHIALIASAVALVLLLVFILQNGRTVRVTFLGASGDMPLAVAILFAAIGGALLVAIAGTARIIQLRRAARAPQTEKPSR